MSSYSSPGTIANDLTGRSHLYEPRVSRSPAADSTAVVRDTFDDNDVLTRDGLYGTLSR